jgi:hypothetical protein
MKIKIKDLRGLIREAIQQHQTNVMTMHSGDIATKQYESLVDKLGIHKTDVRKMAEAISALSKLSWFHMDYKPTAKADDFFGAASSGAPVEDSGVGYAPTRRPAPRAGI